MRINHSSKLWAMCIRVTVVPTLILVFRFPHFPFWLAKLTDKKKKTFQTITHLNYFLIKKGSSIWLPSRSQISSLSVGASYAIVISSKKYLFLQRWLQDKRLPTFASTLELQEVGDRSSVLFWVWASCRIIL